MISLTTCQHFLFSKTLIFLLECVTKLKRCMKNFILENFIFELNSELSRIDFDSAQKNVNSHAHELTTLFKAVLDKHAPLRAMSRNEKRLSKKPWITRGLLKSIRTKNKLFKTCYKSDDVAKKQKYKKYLNKLTHLKNISKRNYYESLITENQNSPNKSWSVINEIIDYENALHKSKLPSSMKIDDHTFSTDSQVFLEKMADYFANIGAHMNKEISKPTHSTIKIYSQRCLQSCVLYEITEDEVNGSIDCIKIHSSQEFDQIPAKFLKLAKCVLAPILAKLFNKCIKQKTFPDEFKIACVVPIPKIAALLSLGDFRPTSLLTFFSKIFEKILENRIRNFIQKHDILSHSQYGFTRNSSTELAITKFYDILLTNMNDKKVTCSIFLDLKKAFDSVSHNILLKKLEHCGFRGPIWNLLKSYLSERKICTKMNQKVSKLHIVKFGVPQGSVLRPILFLLYVNDLPGASKFETTLFADHTNLHLSAYDVNTLQAKVDSEILNIENWINVNRLTINCAKSAFMIISRNSHKTPNFQVKFKQSLLKRKNSLKYLCVHLDCELNWKTHINKISKKLSKTCGMIFKLRHYVPKSTLKLVYYSLFHSTLQYSLLNWGRASKSHLQKLRILQNKIIRASLFCPRKYPTFLLYSRFGVLQLDDMIKMEFAKFANKFYNKKLPNSFDNYFTDLKYIHNYNTRQKDRSNFYHRYVRSETGRKKLQHICVNVWENISLQSRNCSFVIFKKKFKQNCIANYCDKDELFA